jgi:hypothetical protein
MMDDSVQRVREQLNEGSHILYRPLESLLMPTPGTGQRGADRRAVAGIGPGRPSLTARRGIP